MENTLILILLLIVAIIYKTRMMNSKIDTLIKNNDTLIKSNEQLKHLISEQSEVIRTIKVKNFGTEQVKDLPPGTKTTDINLK